MTHIYLYDKNKGKNKKELRNSKSLENVATTLQQEGYHVTYEGERLSLDSHHDLLILHPRPTHIPHIREFHEQHPETPILMHSRYWAGTQPEKTLIQFTLTQDANGIYSTEAGLPASFLQGVQHILQRKT